MYGKTFVEVILKVSSKHYASAHALGCYGRHFEQMQQKVCRQ